MADGVVDGLGCFVVGSYDVGDDAAIALQFVLEGLGLGFIRG